MKLVDLVRDARPPEPFAAGEGIPWREPGFSRRMLAEHLSEAHDAASRRPALIAAHVAWLHQEVLRGAPGRVLDLGCGPGLYLERLARLGHEGVGIDFSPASIEFARARARDQQLACSYREEDLCRAALPDGFDLALMISGEWNTLPAVEAHALLERVRAALRPGASLVLEVHTLASIEAIGRRPPRWRALASGLFSERPHLWLEEYAWHAAARVATRRHVIVDAATGEVARYSSSLQGYSDAEYATRLAQIGFEGVRLVPSLHGAPDPTQSDFLVVHAQRSASEGALS